MMLDIGQLQDNVKVLDKGDEAARRQTIHSLKQHEDKEWETAPPKVIQSLVTVLKKQLSNGTKQPAIRQEVATILGKMGPRSEPAIPQLVELLEEGTPDAICEAAATALGKIGKEARVAVDPLIGLLANRRPSIALHAIRALGDIGCADQRVKNALINLWLAPGQTQKSQIELAIALCKLKINAPGLQKYLAATLVSHPDSALRKLAAEALSRCDKDEADVVPALLTSALHDKDESVRLKADTSLQALRLSRDKAILLCAKQLMESTYAEAALRNSGQPAVPALVEALGSSEPMAREKACRILGSFGELAVDAVQALKPILRDKNTGVRLAAAKAYWHITKNVAVAIPVFVDLLGEKSASAYDDAETRRRFIQSVIESLGRIGPPAQGAVSALTAKTKDKNRLISESALTALKEIAPAVAVKVAARA
jgi:HEAT repeat protein